MDSSIHKLTSAIASGDTEAFACFYRDWFDRACSEARRATGRDESFCLDVVQDAMMRVIKSIKPIENEAALATWMRLTIQSCAYDRLRQEGRRRRREQEVQPATTAADEDAGTTDSGGIRDRELDERLVWLRRELDACDDRTITLLTMRHRFGWTLAQIGTALGLKPGAVDGRLRRTLDALRQRAKEAFNE